MTWRGRLRGHRDQRGAVIVEAALVLPIVMLVLFGMLEMGLYWKDSLTLSEGAKDAAHADAEWASDATADYYGVQAIKSVEASINGSVVGVIIYNAAPIASTSSSTVTAPSAACLASLNGGGNGVTVNDGSGNPGAIGSCNIYYPSDFNRPVTDWSGAAQGSVVFPASRHWPGETRDESTTQLRSDGVTLGPDIVGVYLKSTHGWVTGIVSAHPTTITDQAVFRIEPHQ